MNTERERVNIKIKGVYIKMKQVAFDTVAAVIGAVVLFLFGAWDFPLITLLVFIALDYITGVMCAIIKKELSSEIGAVGLLKKAMILVILIAGVNLDRLIGCEWVIRTAVCCFYIANEGISIVENSAKLGVPVPGKIKKVLAQLRADSDSDDGSDEH